MANETSERVRDDFSRWASQFRRDVVLFGEDRDPTNMEEWPDFRIKYRAWCKTASPKYASVYLASGEDIREGHAVGIFIERRERIADRLGVRPLPLGSREWSDETFGGGFEASKIGISTLFLLLDLIAKGQISIRARVWPLLGMSRTAAVATQEVRSKFESLEGYDSSWWLLPAEQVRLFSTLVTFEAWPRQ